MSCGVVCHDEFKKSYLRRGYKTPSKVRERLWGENWNSKKPRGASKVVLKVCSNDDNNYYNNNNNNNKTKGSARLLLIMTFTVGSAADAHVPPRALYRRYSPSGFYGPVASAFYSAFVQVRICVYVYVVYILHEPYSVRTTLYTEYPVSDRVYQRLARST